MENLVVISLKISNFSFTTFQSTTFHVVYKNVPGALTLDWTDGFLLKPFASPTYAFTYRYWFWLMFFFLGVESKKLDS